MKVAVRYLLPISKGVALVTLCGQKFHLDLPFWKLGVPFGPGVVSCPICLREYARLFFVEQLFPP